FPSGMSWSVAQRYLIRSARDRGDQLRSLLRLLGDPVGRLVQGAELPEDWERQDGGQSSDHETGRDRPFLRQEPQARLSPHAPQASHRSEERRVGKEWRFRGPAETEKKRRRSCKAALVLSRVDDGDELRVGLA